MGLTGSTRATSKWWFATVYQRLQAHEHMKHWPLLDLWVMLHLGMMTTHRNLWVTMIGLAGTICDQKPQWRIHWKARIMRKIYRKPSIFPWNIGVSCNFHLKPIHWTYVFSSWTYVFFSAFSRIFETILAFAMTSGWTNQNVMEWYPCKAYCWIPWNLLGKFKGTSPGKHAKAWFVYHEVSSFAAFS